MRNAQQQYQCKCCKKYFRESYRIKRLETGEKKLIVTLNNVGAGIRSIAKMLQVSPTTIIRQIRTLSSQIKPPLHSDENAVYEVDEL